MDPEKANKEMLSPGQGIDKSTGASTATASDPPIEPPDLPKTGFSETYDFPDIPAQGTNPKPAEGM